MHRCADTALSSLVSTWSSRLLQALVCVGCLAAGAALVITASPKHRLNAGSTPQSSSGESVLLDFTATWCGPCQQMSPIVERLAHEGYPIRKVDVDKQRAIAERFQITSMPTFVLVVDGREVMRQTGMTSESQLRRMLLQIPSLQQEIASTPRANPTPKRSAPSTPANDVDFGPSPFAVDLGTPQSTDSLADSAPQQRGFGLPLFQRDRDPAPTRSAAATGEPVVRAQSSDADIPAATVPASDPMAASTRLRVKDVGGMNFGSGTILESRVGRTLILTCGHIFRQLGEDGIVEVDVFISGQKPVTFVGKVITFDLDTDIGLVAIPTSQKISAIPLASIDKPLQVGDSLVSIGCGGGDLPSRENVEVTAINKYTGAANIECTGLPVQGRSGGGLFHNKQLVGVCIAADPKDQRGVFTALGPVYELLEKFGFGHLLPVGRPAHAPVVATAAADVPVQTMPAAPPMFAETGALPGEVDLGTAIAEAELANVTSENSSRHGADDLQQVLGQAPDSEVICIVRPKNPQIPSRVVIIHEASPKLISYLLDSVGNLPTKPGSMNDLFTRSSGLVPTTAVESAAPSPFGPSPFAPSSFAASPVSPVETLPASTARPLRPTSPR